MVQLFVGCGLKVILLEAKNVSFIYDGADNAVINNISIEIKQGEAIAITGPSGSGKSTLLYLLAGILPGFYFGKMDGEVLISGKPVKSYSRAELASKIGIVFQNPNTQLFCETVEDELAFGPENLCLDKKEIDRRITETLELCGIENLRYERPDKMSGGQKQMIAFASVLALKPEILFMDEAFSQIDEQAKERILARLKVLKEKGCTIVMVDHNKENTCFCDKSISIGDCQYE